MKRLLVVFVLLFAMVGCQQPAAPAADGGGEADAGPIKIGGVFDLTGPTSGPGSIYAEGIKGYVEWLNANGGVEGREVELIAADYAYKVDQAEQLYSQYVNQDNVVAFSGWGTGDTEALRGKVADDQIPFISASYSINIANPEEAPYNFLVGTSYSDQIVIALQWIIDQGAGTKVAVLHHDSPFGKSPVPDAEEFAAENGLELLAVAMPGGATDLSPELSQVQSFGAEYIIIQNVSSPAALAMRNAQDLGMDVQFICLNWCADEILVELAQDAAEGAIGAMPFTPPSVDTEGDDVIRAFLEEKGESLDEKGSHYSQGWAAMEILIEGIRLTLAAGQEVTGENIKTALEGMSDYDTGGITAPITFTAEDHRGNKALRLFQVEGGNWNALTDYIESDIALK